MRSSDLEFNFLILILFISGCHTNPGDKSHRTTSQIKGIGSNVEKTDTFELVEVSYHLLPAIKPVIDSLTPEQIKILLALNRVDIQHLHRLDSLIVPDLFFSDLKKYSPFPQRMKALDSVKKIIFYSYPIEAFAAYENGTLVRWGPASLGKQSTPTPTGLFFTNWRAKKTVSSFNDEWVMKWYFNLRNFSGVSMHQYDLPGYPASHACVRLLEDDAFYFYSWCEPWILDDKRSIAVYGTPVIIFGAYAFGQRKPWFALAENNEAIRISEVELTEQLKNFLPLIMERQSQRNSDTTRAIN